MVQSAEDRLRDDISDQFDPASAGSILPKRKVSARLVMYAAYFARMRRKCSALNTIK